MNNLEIIEQLATVLASTKAMLEGISMDLSVEPLIKQTINDKIKEINEVTNKVIGEEQARYDD